VNATAAPTFREGDRVVVAGQLHGFATFLGLIDDAHAFVQFPDHVEQTPVATSFLTPADREPAVTR
jgi:hypothetical protein